MWNKQLKSCIWDLFRRMPTNTFDVLCVRGEDAGTVKILTFIINCNIIQFILLQLYSTSTKYIHSSTVQY